MDPSFASLEQGELHGIEHGIHPTIEDLPDDILAKSLLGMEAPFSHRRICKQLRSLFDDSRTCLRIQQQGPGHFLPDPAAPHEEPCWYINSESDVLHHGDLLSLLRRLPRLDTFLDLGACHGQAWPWEKMGQILGGQLTRLVCPCDWQLGFLRPFPSLRRLEVGFGAFIYHGLRRSPLRTLELQPLSALHALQHLDLRGLPVKDLSPLTGCRQLQFLNLSFCPIKDLRPLTACVHLQLLDLRSCPIKDLGPLVQCTELRSLKLAGNDLLRDLGPLGACASLQHLDLNGCRSIMNLRPLKLCTDLLYLNLSSSLASDFQVFSSCTGLQRLHLSSCAHLHCLESLANCRKLQHLDISSNIISSLEPLWGLQGLQTLYLWRTQASRLGETQPELGPLTSRVKLKLLHFPYGFVEGL